MDDWPPTSEEILDLPIDDLGIRLLRELKKYPRNIHRGNLIAANHSLNLRINDLSITVWRAIGEAYDWLMFNGYLSNNPGPDNSDFANVTRLGLKLLEETDPLIMDRALRRIGLDLHPLIAHRVRREFLSGEYESAVLMAFREVEIRVRNLGAFDNSKIGVKLMQEAFSPNVPGPLLDSTLERGEQEAMMYLFAGAIGSFKNPSSHRQVDYGDATVASEAVLLADLLLRILDRYETSPLDSPQTPALPESRMV